MRHLTPACNLASLNLLKFKAADGSFDVDRFKAAVRIFITAQEIMVDNASYPTAAITENSHIFRTLGLGYANLGALIMSYEIGCDSDEGRSLAGAITALMTGEAYARSARLAAQQGPFPGYRDSRCTGVDVPEALDNVDSMLEVIRKHTAAALVLNASAAGKSAAVAAEAAESWQLALELGMEHGYRNAQVTVLAPTGGVTAESMVLSPEGLLPIVKMQQENATSTGRQFSVNGIDRIYRVCTTRGHELRGTGKHQLRVITAAGAVEWRRMEDIQPGDLLALLLGGHEELLAGKAYVELTGGGPRIVDEALAELLGFYMGNGYIKRTGGMSLVVPDTSPDVMAHFDQWGAQNGYKPTRETRKGCQVVMLNDRRWKLWAADNGLAKPHGKHGEGAAGAFIPGMVLRSRSSVLAAFLRGLFEADGTVTLQTSGSPVVEMSTVSRELAQQVMVALEALGCAATAGSTTDRQRCYGDRTLYRVRVASVEDARVFDQKIGFISERKRMRLKGALSGTLSKSRSSQSVVHQVLIDDFYAASSGMPWDVRADIRVRKNKGRFSPDWARRLISGYQPLGESLLGVLFQLGNLQFVCVKAATYVGLHQTYEISIPGCDTYLANGFINHNTANLQTEATLDAIAPVTVAEPAETVQEPDVTPPVTFSASSEWGRN